MQVMTFTKFKKVQAFSVINFFLNQWLIKWKKAQKINQYFNLIIKEVIMY